MHPVVRAILQSGGTFKGKAYFDGNGDYLSLADSSDWYFGSGNFTVERKIKRISLGSIQFLFGQSDINGTENTRSFYGQLNVNNTVTCGIASGLTLYAVTSSATIADTNEHDIAFVRDGNTLRLFIDGNADGTASVVGITANNSTYPLAISSIGTNTAYCFSGYGLGERITKDIARYTGNYTKPDYYENDLNTVLCMNYGEAIGATTFIDATGKTVTTNGNVVIVE